MDIYSCFSHYKWWFSIAMLVITSILLMVKSAFCRSQRRRALAAGGQAGTSSWYWPWHVENVGSMDWESLQVDHQHISKRSRFTMVTILHHTFCWMLGKSGSSLPYVDLFLKPVLGFSMGWPWRCQDPICSQVESKTPRWSLVRRGCQETREHQSAINGGLTIGKPWENGVFHGFSTCVVDSETFCTRRQR